MAHSVSLSKNQSSNVNFYFASDGV